MTVSIGSIPAHAGEPGLRSGGAGLLRVYPRACGGTVEIRVKAGQSRGLSPRMRGNPTKPKAFRSEQGSIPAHAGEPASRNTSASRSRVYPRACGGTPPNAAPIDFLQGLSPRMRGNHLFACSFIPLQGSIPAHAGEPRSPSLRSPGRRVYPRACGGTSWVRLSMNPCSGLSPRMRGNRLRELSHLLE